MSDQDNFVKVYKHIVNLYRKYPDVFKMKSIKKFQKNLKTANADFINNLAKDVIYSFEYSRLVNSENRNDLDEETFYQNFEYVTNCSINLIPAMNSDIVRIVTIRTDIEKLGGLMYRLYAYAIKFAEGPNDPIKYKSEICKRYTQDIDLASKSAQYILEKEILEDRDIIKKREAIRTSERVIDGSVKSIGSELNMEGNPSEKYNRMQEKIKKFQKKLKKDTETGKLKKESMSDVLSGAITAMKNSGELDDENSMYRPILNTYIDQIKKKSQNRKLDPQQQKIMKKLEEFYNPEDVKDLNTLKKQTDRKYRKALSKLTK